MRTTLRGTLAVFVAVAALGAVAAASASAALPEFETEGAKYPIAFTGTLTEGYSAHFSYIGRGGECKQATISGEITGPKELAKVVMKFSNGACASYEFCETLTYQSWETKELTGRIAYTNKEHHEAGLLLEPAAQPFALCKGKLVRGEITGSVIGTLSSRTGRTLSLDYQSDGTKQEPKHFEGEGTTHYLSLVREKEAPSEVGMATNLTLTLSSGQLHLRD
jgi:hypothetical protein